MIRLMFLVALVVALWLGVVGAVVLFAVLNMPTIFAGVIAGIAACLWITSRQSESRR